MSNNPNNYQQQKLRGLKRKYEAVQSRGGKCERCGYNGNLAALDFHHRDPQTKNFQIDLRSFSNTNLDTLKEELDKCDLLCANCHREIHYPNLKLDEIEDLINTEAKNKVSFNKNYLLQRVNEIIEDFDNGYIVFIIGIDKNGITVKPIYRDDFNNFEDLVDFFNCLYPNIFEDEEGYEKIKPTYVFEVIRVKNIEKGGNNV